MTMHTLFYPLNECVYEMLHSMTGLWFAKERIHEPNKSTGYLELWLVCISGQPSLLSGGNGALSEYCVINYFAGVF
jgi:hypothetical protein